MFLSFVIKSKTLICVCVKSSAKFILASSKLISLKSYSPQFVKYSIILSSSLIENFCTSSSVKGLSSKPKKVFTSLSVKPKPFLSIKPACSFVNLPLPNCLTIRITFWYCLPDKFLIASFDKGVSTC